MMSETLIAAASADIGPWRGADTCHLGPQITTSCAKLQHAYGQTRRDSEVIPAFMM